MRDQETRQKKNEWREVYIHEGVTSATGVVGNESDLLAFDFCRLSKILKKLIHK